MAGNTEYMSVKQAMAELEDARLASLELPTLPPMSPFRSHLNSKATLPKPFTGTPRYSPRLEVSSGEFCANLAGFPKGSAYGSPNSSISMLGLSNLNSAHNFSYGAEPLKPQLTNNEYQSTGQNSMFGTQSQSLRASSSAFGFGTSTRDNMKPLYLSNDHMRINISKFAPCPTRYNLLNSMGKQPSSKQETFPQYRFSREERFDKNRREHNATTTPGPGTYKI